jgi:hypothetical protein
MQFGDIEGLNKIYDSEGIMIPQENECVLSTLNGYIKKVEQEIHKHWRIMFFDGPGLFVLTDKRLVFLREPQKYNQNAKFSGKRLAELADWEYWTNRSNKAREAGAKEFIELPYSEIETVRNGKKLSEITVRSKNKDFRIALDCVIGNELETLQNQKGKIEPLLCFEKLGRD